MSRDSIGRANIISSMLSHYYPNIPKLDKNIMIDRFAKITYFPIKCTALEWLHAEVVAYARHELTDYDLLLKGLAYSNDSRKQVLDTVKPKLTLIMSDWMGK